MTSMREWALQEAAQWIRSVRNDGVVEDTFKDAEDQAFAKRELGRIAFRLNKEAGIRACRACGCTDAAACEGGCSWAEADLCSSCVPEPSACPARARWGIRKLACVKKPNHKPPHESIGGHLWKDSDRRAIATKPRKARRRR